MTQAQWEMLMTIFAIIAGVSGSNVIIYWSVNRRIDDLREFVKLNSDTLRVEVLAAIHRVEQVMDARLKHLEEKVK